MPTGYTAGVMEGKITTFSDFALTCARAFGACITMRDEAFDAAIPERFKPPTHAADQYARAKQRLNELRAMTPREYEIAAAVYYEEGLAQANRWNADNAVENERLHVMLAKVKAWHPPTPEHVAMKKFMEIQIGLSLHRHVHKPPWRLDAATWRQIEIRKAQRDLDYHAAEQIAENDRAQKRTEWLQQLRASFANE
jgi:hypothetical protein